MNNPQAEPERSTVAKGQLLFVVSEDWYFSSHRMDLAKTALAEGWKVRVACQETGNSGKIESAGISVSTWYMPRGSHNPLKYILAVISLRKLIHVLQPDIVHAVSIVTVVVARLALSRRREIGLVSTVAGIGRLFSHNKRSRPLVSRGLKLIGRWLTLKRNYRLVTQNLDDFEAFGGHKVRNLILIPGSGINPQDFPKTPLPVNPETRVLLVARMISDKGVFEFVQAIQLLNRKGLKISGFLVGRPDSGNPRSLSEGEIHRLTYRTSVAWLGHREDIYELIAEADIICLPTHYGEGIPRILLEAGCVGRPVVSCSVPGPQDLVRDGVDGFLVRPREPEPLAEALKTLVLNPTLRKEMGDSFHARVTQDYSNSLILNRFFDLYKAVLGK